MLIKKNLKKYLVYAIGEIILIVIGILIAVSLNNWKQDINLKKVKENLYSDLIEELKIDLVEIHGNRTYNQKYLDRYRWASSIIFNDTQKKLVDTLAVIATELTNFSDFKKDESAYEKLAASGKLELITNNTILNKLQSLGILYNYINRLEKNQEQFMFTIIPKISEYIRYKPLQVIQPEKLYNYKFHNDIVIFIKIGTEKETLYSQAESILNDLVNSLKKELNNTDDNKKI